MNKKDKEFIKREIRREQKEKERAENLKNKLKRILETYPDPVLMIITLQDEKLIGILGRLEEYRLSIKWIDEYLHLREREFIFRQTNARHGDSETIKDIKNIEIARLCGLTNLSIKSVKNISDLLLLNK